MKSRTIVNVFKTVYQSFLSICQDPQEIPLLYLDRMWSVHRNLAGVHVRAHVSRRILYLTGTITAHITANITALLARLY